MKLLIALSILISSQISIANSNPQMRTCRIHLAQFWSYEVTEPKSDHIGFCRYNNAMVDSISFMTYAFQKELSLSLGSYFDSKTQSFSSCKAAGAKLVLGKDSNDYTIKLCVFRDYSFISKRTLVKGWDSLENRDLSRALDQI